MSENIVEMSEDVVVETFLRVDHVAPYDGNPVANLRWAQASQLTIDNHDVDVDLHCIGVTLLYRTHVVLLVVVGSSRC